MSDNYIALSPEERQDFLDVIRSEWNPGYAVMYWCASCVIDMVKMAFKNMDNELHSSDSPNRA